MYSIGERVIYGSSGACEIIDIRKEAFGGAAREYYVLTPLGGGSSIFVPTDNEQLVGRMRAPLTRKEILDMIVGTV